MAPDSLCVHVANSLFSFSCSFLRFVASFIAFLLFFRVCVFLFCAAFFWSGHQLSVCVLIVRVLLIWNVPAYGFESPSAHACNADFFCVQIWLSGRILGPCWEGSLGRFQPACLFLICIWLKDSFSTFPDLLCRRSQGWIQPSNKSQRTRGGREQRACPRCSHQTEQVQNTTQVSRSPPSRHSGRRDQGTAVAGALDKVHATLRLGTEEHKEKPAMRRQTRSAAVRAKAKKKRESEREREREKAKE
jgi:hypothetical protein